MIISFNTAKKTLEVGQEVFDENIGLLNSIPTDIKLIVFQNLFFVKRINNKANLREVFPERVNRMLRERITILEKRSISKTALSIVRNLDLSGFEKPANLFQLFQCFIIDAQLSTTALMADRHFKTETVG